MTNAHPVRIFATVLTSMVILTGCGSTDSAESANSTPPTTAAAAEEVIEGESAENTTVPEVSTTVDDRTPEEIAIDELDVTAFQLGVQDLAGAADCVVARLESEGIELTGTGTAELLALTACEPDVISAWLPDSNPALSDDVWACTVENIGEWLNNGTIAEGEAFLGAAQPPAEFIELTAERCEASVEELEAALA